MPRRDNMPHPWWGLGGPARFLDRAAAGVAGPSGVLALGLPSPVPDGWLQALIDRIDEQVASTPVAVDASVGLLGRSPVRMLATAAGLETSGLRVVADFLDDPAVADTVFVVHGAKAEDWRQWSLFLRGFRADREARPRSGAPSIAMVLPRSVYPEDVRAAFGAAPLRWMGAVSRLDTRIFVEGLSGRPDDDLLSRAAIETTVELAGWDRELAKGLAALSPKQQLDPRDVLAEYAKAYAGQVPCWENGLVDMWDGSPHVSTLALIAAGDEWALRSRLWAAQVRAVFPFINSVRSAYVDKYRSLLLRRLPYEKTFNDRKVVYEQADKLELFDLMVLLRGAMPQAERTLLADCLTLRRMMAHVDPAEPWRIMAASAQWERMEHEFPHSAAGWDWPRCGQGLVLMVGPSGAGKSTYAAQSYDPADVVSSDAIRIELFGSLAAEGDQGPVFDRVRAEVRLRLSSGRSAVVDATHLKASDRVANARLAPVDMPVEYVVIDRAMQDKVAAGGWRLERPGLLDNHAKMFAAELPDIMDRDGLANVTVTIPPLDGQNTTLVPLILRH